MFARLRRWWIERRLKKERLLYRVFNGSKLIAVDPWQAWDSLHNDPEFDFERHFALAQSGSDPEAGYLIRAICRAFGVERFSVQTQRGLTDAELHRILDEFLDFIEAIQKKTNDSLTPLRPTGQA